MDFRLQVFKSVAEKLNFTKASAELHISQPAVSKHIRQLEQHYNTMLFEREGNSIKLTAEGKVLLDHTRRILEEYSSIENYFLTQNQQISKEVSIGASTTIAQYVLPEILVKLHRRFPDTAINLINANSTEIEEMIQNSEVDFGLIEGTQNNPLLEYEKFTADEIVLACKNGLRSGKHTEISLSDLKSLPVLYRERGSGTRKIIEKNLAEHSVTAADLKIEAVLGSSESIKNYLLKSETYSFISIHSIQDELREAKMQIIDLRGLNIERQFYFVKKQGQNSTTYKTLKTFIQQNHN